MKKDYSLKAAFKSGWNLWKDNFFLLVGPLLLWLVVTGVLAGVSIGEITGSLEVFLSLLSRLIGAVFQFGFVKLLIDLYKGKEVEFKTGILTKDKYTNLLLYTTILFVVTELGIKLAEIFEVVGIVIAVSILVYLLIRLFFVEYLIIDQDKNFLEAIELSLEMTQGDVLWLLLFGIISILLIILGVFPGIILGLIFVTLPTIIGAKVYVYANFLKQIES